MAMKTYKNCILMAVWIFFSAAPTGPKQSRIEYPCYRFLYSMTSVWYVLYLGQKKGDSPEKKPTNEFL